MNDNPIRESLKACLASSSFPQNRQREVLERIQETKHMNKKLSYTLVFAAVLILALGSLAIAAGLGVFGSFSQDEDSYVNGTRLERLDEAAQRLDDSASVVAPEVSAPPETATLYDALLARQSGRTFELTLNQAYCDGHKLYYVYTLQTNQREVLFGEDEPTGFADWDWSFEGQTLKDVLEPYFEEEYPELVPQLSGDALRYVIIDNVALGDGADIDDGSERGISTMIYDSNQEWGDARTLTGFQEVELPQDYEVGERIDLLLPIHYSTTLYYEDEAGVHEAYIRQSENRGILRVPFTVEVGGSAQALTGTLETNEYTATASLSVSDVTIYGEVVFDAPEWEAAWKVAEDFLMSGCIGEPPEMPAMINSYQLIAGEEIMRNVGGGFGLNSDGHYRVQLEFDLPASMEALELRPETEELQDDVIVLK